MSQQWPPQPPDGGPTGDPNGQPNPYGQPAQPSPAGDPYGQPNPYGQPGQPSQFGQPGQPNPYGQYGPPSQYGQPGQPSQFGQPGQSGPPSQGFPPPGVYPSYPAYPTYPGQQPGQPGTWGPPSQYGVGQYPTGYPQPGFGAPPPQKSRGWVVPLIIGLIILLVLGGGGTVYALTRGGGSTALATPTATLAPTATSTPSAPLGFTLYTDSDGNFSLLAPSAWSTTPTAEYVELSSDSDEALVEVGYETVATGTLGDDVDSFFTSVTATGGGTISNHTGPIATTLGGETASESTGDWTVSSLTYHVVVIAANHNSGRGLVVTLAPSDTYSSLDTQYFHTMVQSFTFLK